MAIELEVRSNASKAFSVIDRLREKLSRIEKTDVNINARGAEGATKQVQAVNKELDKVKVPRAPRIDTQNLERDTGRISKNLEVINASAIKLRDTMTATALTLGGMATVGSLVMLSDSLTNMQNRLQALTSDANAFRRAWSDVETIAFNTRSQLTEATALFSRLVQASGQLEASQSQIASLTSAVSKALAVGGATAQESASAMLQLGQALGSGVLQGQELVAIMEASVPLTKAIADGLGVSVGALKKMGSEGRLTSKEVFEAILKQSYAIDRQFQKMSVTFGQAFTNLGNAGTLLFDSVSKTLFANFHPAKFINSFALSIRDLAKNFDFLIFKYEGRFLLFASRVYEGFASMFRDLPKMATQAFDAVFSSAKLGYTIDAASIFPKLSEIPRFVKNIVNKIEYSFFWLYDRVIGHSWVPDLVEGTIYWFGKLSVLPVKIVEGLTHALDVMFYAASVAAEKLGSILGMAKQKVLMSIEVQDRSRNQVVEKQSANTSALEKNTSELKNTQSVYDGAAQAWISAKSQFNVAVDSLRRTLTNSSFVRAFESSNLAAVHSIKQILGLRDKVQYEYDDPNSPTGVSKSDPNAKVGRGPRRNDDPGIFHNIVNALPVKWQVPMVTSLAGVALLAVTKVFSGSSFFGVIVTGVIAAMGFAMARVVDSQEMLRSAKNLADTLLIALKSGMSLISGGILQNAAGMVTLIAKLFLMLEGGKKSLFETITAIAAAPTNMGRTWGRKMESLSLDRTIQRLDTSIGRIQGQLARNLQDATNNMTRVMAASPNNAAAVSLAQRLMDRATAQSHAYDAFVRYQRAKDGTTAKTAAKMELALRENTLASLGVRNSAVAQIRELQGSREKAADLSKTVKTQLAETRAKSRESFQAAGTFLGGSAGSILGYRAASKYADESEIFKSSSPWLKESFALLSSVLAQSLGASLGQILFTAIFSIGSKLSIPVVAAIAGLGFVIFALFNGVEKTFDDLVAVWRDIPWETIGTFMFDTLKENLENLGRFIGQTIFDLLPDSMKGGKAALSEVLPKREDGSVDVGSTAVFGGLGVYALARAKEFGQAAMETFRNWLDFKKYEPFINQSKAAQDALANAARDMNAMQAGNLRNLQAADARVLAARDQVQALQMVTGQTSSSALEAAERARATILSSNARAVAEIEARIATAESSLAQARAGAATVESGAVSIGTQIRNMFASISSGSWLTTMRTTITNFPKELFNTTVAALGALIGSVTLATASLTAILAVGIGSVAAWLINKAWDSISGKDQPTDSETNPRVKAIPRASGGWISGPGGPRDDKIPALLSNGEFVVNAASAARNRDLLERINSGEVARFADGGNVKATSLLKRPYQFFRNASSANGKFAPEQLTVNSSTIDSESGDYLAQTFAESLASAVAEMQRLGFEIRKTDIDAIIRLAMVEQRTNLGYNSTQFREGTAFGRHYKDLKASTIDILNRAYGTNHKSFEGFYKDNGLRVSERDDLSRQLGIYESSPFRSDYHERPERMIAAKRAKYEATKAAFVGMSPESAQMQEAFKRMSKAQVADFYKMREFYLNSTFEDALNADGVRSFTHRNSTPKDAIVAMFLKMAATKTKSVADLIYSGLWNGKGKVSGFDGRTIADSEFFKTKLRALDIPENNAFFMQMQAAMQNAGVQGFASGGFISGPGGSRDDKIPALLSNGEFVVNAAATSRNYDLLNAINSGAVAKFSEGGGVNLKKRVAELATKQGLDPSFVNAIILVESNYTPNAVSTTGAAGLGQLTVGTARGLGLYVDPKAIQQIRTWNDSIALLAKDLGSREAAIRHIGYPTIDPKLDERFDPEKNLEASVRYLAQLHAQFGRDIVKTATAYNAGPGALKLKLAAYGDEWSPAVMSRAEAREYAPKVVAKMSGASVPQVTSQNDAPLKTTAEKAGAMLKQGFEMGRRYAEEWLASISSFLGMTENTAALLYRITKGDSSKSLAAGRDAIDAALKTDPRLAALGINRAKLDEFNAEELKAIAERIDVFRELGRAEVLAKKNISGFQAEGLREQAISGLQALQRGVNPAHMTGTTQQLSFYEKLKGANTDTETLQMINSAITSINATEKNLTKPLLAFNAASFETQEELLQLAEAIDQYSRAATGPDNFLNKMVKANALKRLEKVGGEYSDRLRIGIENGLNRPASAKAVEAGVSMASQVTSELKSGLTSVLTGKKGLFKALDKDSTSFLTDVLDSVTSKIVNTFVDGLVTSFMKSTGLEKKIQNMFTGEFSFGEMLGERFGPKKPPVKGAPVGGDAIKPDFADSATTAVEEVVPETITGKVKSAIGGVFEWIGTSFKSLFQGVFGEGGFLTNLFKGVFGSDGVLSSMFANFDISSLFSSFSSGLETVMGGMSDMLGGLFRKLSGGLGSLLSGIGSGGGDLFGSIFSSIGSLFLAGGGPVYGPGTSTSDSIPAMLSNGEFVVNAAQTSRFRPVLEQINRGKFPRLASGGYVGDSLASAPTMSSKSNSTTFNINITGDISRQTRREIISMLPEIASGVNNHNYEQGVK